MRNPQLQLGLPPRVYPPRAARGSRLYLPARAPTARPRPGPTPPRPLAFLARHTPPNAACSFARSSFCIPIIACIARPDFALSLSESIPPSCFGTICQDTPNLSTSQPHCTSLPPFSVSFAQRRSSSACVSTCTMSEKPCPKVNVGPPFSAMYVCPKSSNVTERTAPSGLGPPAG